MEMGAGTMKVSVICPNARGSVCFMHFTWESASIAPKCETLGLDTFYSDVLHSYTFANVMSCLDTSQHVDFAHIVLQYYIYVP